VGGRWRLELQVTVTDEAGQPQVVAVTGQPPPTSPVPGAAESAQHTPTTSDGAPDQQPGSLWSGPADAGGEQQIASLPADPD